MQKSNLDVDLTLDLYLIDSMPLMGLGRHTHTVKTNFSNV